MEAHKFGLLGTEAYKLIDMFPWGAGVDLFFIISGFIISHVIVSQQPNIKNFKHFILRRLIRIAPIYWFYTLLMIAAIMMFSGIIDKDELNPAHIAASFLFIPWPNQIDILRPILAQGWTLNYEMLFYIITAGALFITGTFRKYFISGTILTLFAIGLIFQDTHFIFVFLSDTVILEFLLGIWLYEIYARVRDIPLPLAIGLLLAGTALWILGELYLSDNEYRVIARGIPALLISAAIIMLKPLQSDEGRLNKSFGLLGDASYSLYLCHPFVLVPFAYVWNKVGLDSLLLFIFAAIFASVLASLVSYLLLEKNILRFLHKATATKS